MDSISFEPNLKFVLELNEDLKTKYFKQHEKAKFTLENFSHSLQHLCHKHQKLLADNIELSILNEKLLQIISEHKFNQQNVSTLNLNHHSQVLQCSSNCNLKNSNKVEGIDKPLNPNINNKGIAEKENNYTYIPIFSSDFLLNDEANSFKKCDSPPSSVSHYAKIQSSPILSKRKKLNSKRNNLLLPSTLTYGQNSNYDNQIILSNTSSAIEKHTNEIENISYKKLCKEDSNQCLETRDDIHKLSSESIHDESKHYVLSISKDKYGKTEFLGKSKKLKQIKLSLKRINPAIDSKVNSYENLNSDYNDPFFKINNKLNENKICTVLDNKKECIKSRRILTNTLKKMNTENINKACMDDELIKKSPVHNEKTNLRNKLSLAKKSSMDQIQVKPLSKLSQKKVFFLEDNETNTEIQKISKKDTGITLKSVELKKKNLYNDFIISEKYDSVDQKSFIDDTYFSPVENTIDSYISTNSVNFQKSENKIGSRAPAVKKALLNSFDVIPSRNLFSPDYVYKETPVRLKTKKAQLPGWSCRDCEKWYINLPLEQQEKHKNNCSKHRGKYKVDILTPESFWNPVFEETNTSFSFD